MPKAMNGGNRNSRGMNLQGSRKETPPQEGENKFWDFIPGTGDKPPELLLYGSISSYQSWYGDRVTPNQFNKELDALGDVPEIIVRINSGGGDVFAANAIFTRLKDHDAKITVKIDGWAASAATIIAMAGDSIKIAKNGVFMIHDPAMTVWDTFTAEDFEKMAGELKVIKQSIVNAYAMKTGREEEEIEKLMADETWWTGDEAVENGFCDVLMFEEAETVVENTGEIVVNSVPINTAEFKTVPKTLLNSIKGQESPEKPKEETKVADAKKMETVEDLKAAYPDLVKTIQNEAAEKERKRIKDIEDMAGGNYKDIVLDAKFNNPCTAEQAAVKIVQENNRITEKQTRDTAKDIEDSGVNEVPGAAGQAGEETKNKFEAAIDQLKF